MKESRVKNCPRFLQSKQIYNLLSICTRFKSRPSEVLGIEHTYWAYCFDEACLMFVEKLEKEEVPKFEEDRKANPLLQQMISGTY